MMDCHRWTETLESPLLVIGNGEIDAKLIKRHRGSIIRINNFELSDEAGYRVTHWVSSGYKDINDRPLPYVFIPWVHGGRECKWVVDFIHRTKRKVIFTDSNEHFLKWFPNAHMDWKQFPSTGFCLLAWLWSKDIHPLITGFSGMTTGHYWDKNHKHDHASTALKEISIIINENKPRSRK